MSGSIVSRARVEHLCHPGWTLAGNSGHQVWARPGDVWACECGQRWVAEDAPSNHATVGQRTVDAVVWKRGRKPRRRWFRR